jgi:hypothetical protein
MASDTPDNSPYSSDDDNLLKRLQDEADRRIAGGDPAESTLSDNEIQKAFNEYNAALEEEYQEKIEAEPEDVQELTRDFFKKQVVQAATQIVWIAHNSESDSVRLNACKLILAQAFEDAKQDGDPVRALLMQAGLTTK